MAAEALERIRDEAVVFVVDDNGQNLELVTAYLEDLGCEVRGFAGGRQVLEACDDGLPDLVVLDIMMPGVSGFQVCERLRAMPGGESVPVLMLTALNETADVERAVEAGADDFLIKPVQRAELLTRIRATLRVRDLSGRVDRCLAGLKSLA